MLLACYRGHGGVVEALLANGAGVDASDMYQGTPLNLANMEGHVNVVRALRADGTYINTRDAWGATPLHWVSVRARGGEGNAAIKVLLANGAAVHSKGGEGRTSLHRASQRGGWDVHRALVARGTGADVFTKDHRGRTKRQMLASRTSRRRSIKLEFVTNQSSSLFARMHMGLTFEEL